MVSLKEYRRKRRLRGSPEPPARTALPGGRRFVVQKHAARRLHYDFRLEVDGVLKSWAVPKGPSLNPAEKRLAVEVEDHPLDYANFEGVIPEGHYGAGEVIVWDRGTFEVEGSLPAAEQLKRGELKFILHGRKLAGGFVLVKLRRAEKGNAWLLIKHKDAAADPRWSIEEHDGSVASGRTLGDVAEGQPPSRAATGALRPGQFEGARKTAMPVRVEPALATLADKPFSHPDWLFEIKWDGVRALAWLKDGRFELRSRTGRIITPEYPEIEVLPECVAVRQAILDGEIVVLDEKGRSSFERLQARMNVNRPPSELLRQVPVVYCLFDILYCDGYDLRGVPLIDRKRLLQQLLEPSILIRYSDHQVEKGRELFDLARRQGLEGIVGKQLRSLYPRGRSPLWVKFKVTRECDVVVGGWTAPRGSRERFGALLLGLYDAERLHFIGGVGSGFTERSQKETFEQLENLESKHCPFETVPGTKEKARWVKPALVARVKYGSWTADRCLRAPVFLGLRRDRVAEECKFAAEAPAKAEPEPRRVPAINEPALTRAEDIEQELYRGRAESVALELDGKRVRLTHLNKVFFPESRYTKRHLLAYYYRMADYVLPFLKGRPLVLRRYPDGIAGESFFQKEAGETAPEWMRTVKVYSEERKAEMDYFVADDRPALLYLTNLGCIDHNPWSSRADDLDHPDYVFFDLDPTEGTRFSTVVAVARLIHQKLASLGLVAFLKTSGATGLHLYVPLERRYTYGQVRAFAEIVGRLVAAERPRQITLERSVRKRPRGRVLVDAAQNALGKPLAAVYSVRAFLKAPVSAPLLPAELRPGLRPAQWNIRSMTQRVEKQGDLWADFWQKRQRLDEATRQLDAQVAAHRAR